jgi:hypothetical protein
MDDNGFSSDMETILENIRINATILTEFHRKRFLYYKNQIKYYRIPVLILSALNSVIAVGIPPHYVNQENISLVNCGLSLISGIIVSIELFIGINATMERHMVASREFYSLSTDIFKILSLERAHRGVKGDVYLNDKFSLYQKLVEQSNILEQKVLDQLTPVITNSDSSSLSSSGSSRDFYSFVNT